MSANVLICDDSNIARKQLAKLIPKDWDAVIHFAENGLEALDIISVKSIDLMFLDLNMPVMDGYDTLSRLQEKAINLKTIVVSGDIQPQALERVKQLGALDFLKKPATQTTVINALELHGLFHSVGDGHAIKIRDDITKIPATFSLNDCLQEVSNIAMGKAASVLADMLNVFVKLPVPNVNMLEVSELQMALGYGEKENQCSAISQGFVGSGIAFEALLIFSDASFPDMAKLLNYSGELDRDAEVELLMDVSSVLIGPFMSALGGQLNIDFSHSHPVLLGQHVPIKDLINIKRAHWKKTLAVEIVYEVENYQISCDLMLLFTEDSVDVLERLLSYLAEEE
ncbi:response regulator [Marinomonas sp. 15G1-11]|uniref:Response regulator n=1 Tax=Marinomonas phaeophyticola TaxID=3004091 RepID=A0ABT4JZ42_9GAMM|nr:response regulator [Marinomonas sp. 15G1-11]MCZ2723669.1 response regulator [Marinomonas sp. 15G1-11]